MGKVSFADILEMSVTERIHLVEDLWDSIAAAPESLHLTKGEREELDRRLEAYHKDPDAGSPWVEVKARILAKA